MTNGHLDDEAISAHLDGEATSEEAAHVERCDVCGARLGELRAAAEAIGAPVALDPAARDRAVENAIRLGSTPATVVPLRARRRKAPPPWLVAAALLVVVALVPVLGGRMGGDDSRDEVASSDDAGEAVEESLAFDADGGDAAGGTGPVTFDAGDVGAVNERAVRSLVEEALAAPTASALRGSDDGGGDGAEQEAAGEASGSEAAPTAEGAADAVVAPCEDAARSDFPDLLALRSRALGTYEGEEQSILAFELDTGRVRVLVLSVATCGITFVQDLEPS